MKLIKCLLCSFSEKDDANSLRSKRKEFKGNRINWWWCKGSSWRWCVHLLKVFDYIWLNQLNDWLLNLKMKQKKYQLKLAHFCSWKADYHFVKLNKSRNWFVRLAMCLMLNASVIQLIEWFLVIQYTVCLVWLPLQLYGCFGCLNITWSLHLMV